MYFLTLACQADAVDHLSSELWEAGTLGIRELGEDNDITLLAAFAANEHREQLLKHFASHLPSWRYEPDTDWVKATQEAWPARAIGERLFLAPMWRVEPTPPNRLRLIHNPGSACGTGDHPCTQLALMALERVPLVGALVADIGTGSGILAAAALRFGASQAIALDIDETVLPAARETLQLNGLTAHLIAGSADCLLPRCAHVVIANINATVLLSLSEDLMQIVTGKGRLILTGFPATELPPLLNIFLHSDVLLREEWACVISRPF